VLWRGGKDINTPAARVFYYEENDVAEQERGILIQYECKKNHLPGQITKKLWKGRRGRRVVDVQGSKGGMLLGWEGLGLGEQVA
jgi:hypothetical protein